MNIQYDHTDEETGITYHLDVDFDYHPGSPGSTYGPPETCEPPEPCEITRIEYDLTDITIDGRTVGIDELPPDEAARHRAHVAKLYEGSLGEKIDEKCQEAGDIASLEPYDPD